MLQQRHTNLYPKRQWSSYNNDRRWRLYVQWKDESNVCWRIPLLDRQHMSQSTTRSSIVCSRIWILFIFLKSFHQESVSNNGKNFCCITKHIRKCLTLRQQWRSITHNTASSPCWLLRTTLAHAGFCGLQLLLAPLRIRIGFGLSGQWPRYWRYRYS